MPWQRTVWKVSREKQERRKGCQAGIGSWQVKMELKARVKWVKKGQRSLQTGWEQGGSDSSRKVLQAEDLDEDLNQAAG